MPEAESLKISYPHYRKFRDKAFWKVCSPSLLLVVCKDYYGLTITIYKGEAVVGELSEDANDMEPATLKEFQQAYNEAFWQCQKLNAIV